MLIFPKAKMCLLIFCLQSIFNIITLKLLLAPSLKTLRILSVSNNVWSVTKGAKTGSHLVKERGFFSPRGRCSGRFTLRWCSHPCDVHTGPSASCQDEASFVSPQVSAPVARSWPFLSAFAPPVHREGNRIRAKLRQVSLQCPSAHMTGYTLPLDCSKRCTSV